MVPLGGLQPALGLQKRGRLGEKDAQGAQGGIVESVAGMGPRCAMIWSLLDPPVQDALEEVETSGGCHANLLGLIRISTLTMSMTIDNLKAFTSQNENCCIC